MVADSKKVDIQKSVNGKVNGNGKLLGNGGLNHCANGNSKGMDLLAKTMYRELKKNGYDPGQILDFSGKLVGFVHEDITSTGKEHK
ncbi:MAG: hypothetical protein JW984_12250 [Deltaproteobacteria bacterium]|uniref:Uncharacterized protein n=1 Tax=Candidatus Zymogenus saltonus TaxID=2844893 RepID=A0A9D8KGW7_9DELT|nr:hypothetical protein [Candidatus Zymogenus saltonus]